MLRVPRDSILVGKTLSESRIGTSTGLIILALIRDGRSDTLPSRQTVLRGGDGILVQGRVDQFRELYRLSDLVIEREAPVLKSMVAAKVAYAEVTITEGSPLVGELVRHAAFRSRFDVAVVGEADFVYLSARTGLTAGNISSHMSRLEGAGYVRIEFAVGIIVDGASG